MCLKYNTLFKKANNLKQLLNSIELQKRKYVSSKHK